MLRPPTFRFVPGDDLPVVLHAFLRKGQLRRGEAGLQVG